MSTGWTVDFSGTTPENLINISRKQFFAWRIQGAPPAYAPQQDPILSFSHMFLPKSAHVRGRHPTNGSVPPQWKSWICSWFAIECAVQSLVLRYECIAIEATIGFDTFTIEVLSSVVMSVCSLRTHIKAWHASIAPLLLNQCLCRLYLRGHTFIVKYRCFSFQFKALNDLHASLQL